MSTDKRNIRLVLGGLFVLIVIAYFAYSQSIKPDPKFLVSKSLTASVYKANKIQVVPFQQTCQVWVYYLGFYDFFGSAEFNTTCSSVMTIHH